MYSQYLQCRIAICRRKNVFYNTITETFLSQYKSSERKWECLKLQRSNFHTTRKLHYPTPLSVCFSSILCGIYARRWWLNQTPTNRAMYIKWYRQRRHIFNGTLGFICFILFVYCLTCFERDPIVGSSRFVMFDQTRQMEDAKILYNLIVQNEGNVVPMNDPTYARVAKAIRKLSDSNREIYKGDNWKVTIIYRMYDLASIPNLLILPDKNIIILYDIFNFITNDDQLTFLLAHEMSHGMLLHSSENLSWGVVLDTINVIFTFLIWVLNEGRTAAVLCSGLYIIVSALFSWYKRQHEKEADYLGFQLALKSCIDPREVLVFWDLMKRFKELSGSKYFQFSLFKQHPSVEERERYIIESMPAALELRRKADCSELPQQDPREYLPYYRKDIEKHVQKRLKILGMQL